MIHPSDSAISQIKGRLNYYRVDKENTRSIIEMYKFFDTFDKNSIIARWKKVSSSVVNNKTLEQVKQEKQIDQINRETLYLIIMH